MKNGSGNMLVPAVILVGLCTIFASTQANGSASDITRIYSECKNAVKVLYPNAIIKLHKTKRSTLELLVIENGKKVVSCDKKTFELK